MYAPLKGYMKFLGGGRNWLILVFSLLLAFFMWSVMKLSRNYSSYMRFQVSVTTNIEGRKGSAVAEDVLVIGAKSTGFTILQNRNDNEITTLSIEGVDAKLFHKCGTEEEYALLPDDIRQLVQDALGKDIKVESFATDTLLFRFPLQTNRKVPVMVQSMISYREQYMPYSDIAVRPDSVLIYGDEEVIGKINGVSTRLIKVKGASAPVTGVVEVIPVASVRLSHDEVFYTQEVGRYVEHRVKVPVKISDMPSYANVAIVPQEVELRLRQPFGAAAKFDIADFEVAVDYNEILVKDAVKPQIIKKPDGIISVVMDPVFVEFVL